MQIELRWNNLQRFILNCKNVVLKCFKIMQLIGLVIIVTKIGIPVVRLTV